MADIKTKNRTRTKNDVKEPGLYNVIYINDETTTVDFVVASLETVFGYEHARARELTMKVHEQGTAVVATLPYEVAEQKGVEVTLLARNNGYPLQIRLEPEA